MAAPPIVSYNGVGFPALLTLLFITLKLTHVIDWSWWWVIAPVWISFSIVAAFMAAWGILFLFVKFFTK